MNHSFNGRGNVHDDDESGIYYLVKKPGGANGEKHLVKRPRAPLTSVPMDDDFDAYTYTQTVITSRFPDAPEFDRHRTLAPGAGANLARSRSHGAAGASSQRQQSYGHYRHGSLGAAANQSYGEMTSTSLPPPPRRVPPRLNTNNLNNNSYTRDDAARGQPSSQNHVSQGTTGPQSRDILPKIQTSNTHTKVPSYRSAPGTSDQKGKARQQQQQADVKETYGGYQQYIAEMEQIFSKHGDFDISVNRLNEASGARESVALGRVRSAKSNGRPGVGNARSPLGSGGGGLRRVEAGVSRNTSSKSRAKMPIPAFEEVSRTVVENSKEKTVTISTWREQVAREVDDGIQRTSVYYQGDLQGYARSEMDDIARGSKSSGSGGQHGYLDETMQFVRGDSRSEGQGSTAVDPSFFKPNDESTQIQDSRKPVARNIDGQKNTPPSNSTPERTNKTTLSSSSSPSTHSDPETPPTPPPKPPRLSIKPTEAIKSSTPVDSQNFVSFHPTKDGSVISTIRSTSSASSQTFDSILSSCKPSLIHLTGALEKLGITTVEHLRALGDLNPNIRDRELKDDALRLGVTVMEWAILVDRLRMI